jgi:predicted glycosyltransferase
LAGGSARVPDGGPGRWGDIDATARQALARRREFFLALEQAFAPDLIVIDNYPTGWHGELTDMLTRSRARKFIVFRPVGGDRIVEAVRGDLGPRRSGACTMRS